MRACTFSLMARTNATSIRTSVEVADLCRELTATAVVRMAGANLRQADVLEAALNVAKRHMDEVITELEGQG